jgi:beta-glucanase (GH16 family)
MNVSSRATGSILIAALALTGLLAACNSPAPLVDDHAAAKEIADAPLVDGWRLVWADEFDGETLDPDNWNVVVMPDPHNNELQYYPGRVDADPDANIWLEDGALVIEARREEYEHRHYTSGRISTKGKREFLYGRFEARIQQPGEVGLWPAFWLLGANIDDVGWPACGEIDILEGKGRLSNWTSGALHAGPEPAVNDIKGFEHELGEGSFHDSWHTFAVEWEPLEIRWYVDGDLVHTIAKPAGIDYAYWPFDHGHPFFIILNLALGGWFDEGYPPSNEMEPQRLLVDYVRVFQQQQEASE